MHSKYHIKCIIDFPKPSYLFCSGSVLFHFVLICSLKAFTTVRWPTQWGARYHTIIIQILYYCYANTILLLCYNTIMCLCYNTILCLCYNALMCICHNTILCLCYNTLMCICYNTILCLYYNAILFQ